MIGGLIHNYTLPEPAFHFFIAPMYATGSKTFTGIARVGYNFLSYGFIRKAELSVSGEKFTADDFTDSTGAKNYLGFSKIVPSLKIVFRNKNATSSITKSIQWKTYFIEETGLLFTRDTVNQVDIITYPKINRYLNQLQFKLENNGYYIPIQEYCRPNREKILCALHLKEIIFSIMQKVADLNVRLFAGNLFTWVIKLLSNNLKQTAII